MIKVVAEIGCNHQGNVNKAKLMIETLSRFDNGLSVDIIKFQKRCPKLILSKDKYDSVHPDPKNSFGSTYGKHREFLEFDKETHRGLKNFCEFKNTQYSCSVFDIKSAQEIIELNLKHIKISSATNLNFDVIKFIDSEFNGIIHISLGMTTKDEEEQIVKSFKNKRNNIVLYACTSAYPVKLGDICLAEITRLKNKWGNEINAVGFSGHHTGIVHDIAAAALGAEYIERHFTLDKNLKGTDQSISLEPFEMAKLVKNLKSLEKDLKYKQTDILDCEINIRDRLKDFPGGGRFLDEKEAVFCLWLLDSLKCA